MSVSKKLYEGKALLYPKDETAGSRPDPYDPAPELIQAVQLAQILERPLLLKGEPGCGKSRLAEAVAYELHGKDYKNYFFTWNVKSTSKAAEGLYSIDYLKRLRDAHLPEGKRPADLDIREGGPYLKIGELGKAFALSVEMINQNPGASPPVVLIDEVDKADIDFPNDLLQELDKMEFHIPDALQKDSANPLVIKASRDLRPLIFITSNDEKPLPPAFLRRCLFHYIDFPEAKLKNIINLYYKNLDQEIVDAAVEKFKKLRKEINEEGASNKNISTSELLDWAKIINHYYLEGALPPDLDAPPYYQSLFKEVEQLKKFLRKAPAEPKGEVVS